VKEVNLQIGQVRMKMANITGVQAGLIVLFSNLCMWVILFMAVPLVNSGQIPGVALAVVVLAALASFEVVQPISQAAQYLESNLAAAERLYEIIDAEPVVCDPVDPEPVAETFDLDFLEVTFQYPAPEPSPYGSVRQVPGSLQQAVSGISFGLAVQRKIAVVGASGAGKSTLINLLLRFWEFHSGSLLISGHDIRDIDSYEIREKTAALEQDGYLFNASVRENLLIGCPDATDERLVEAAKTAQIDEFIKGLPKGYSTRVGERGFQLSGGEKQRLLLTRTLLRDSSLLLLDEPTASLDPITERELFDSLKAVWASRSVLFITHRLVGLEDMDEILVMDGGHIVEQGTHLELIQRGGYYQRLWALQHQKLIESLRGMESS
jgi:ATP-binding cassette subfamily C protein CydC